MKKHKFLQHFSFCCFFLSIPFLLLADNEPKKVVATASIFADMAENIAGEHLSVTSIVPIGSDPHLYDPTPSDAQLVVEADLILINALTFEGWLAELIENSGSKAKVVTITEGVNAIKSEAYENSADPHAWMNVANGLIYIENIKNALTELDPDNKEVYAFNYGVYHRQLSDLDGYIETAIQKIPAERRILITSHDAFQYYGIRYGIQLESVLGISTEAEAQTSDIIRLNKVIRTNNVPALFIESTINPKLLEQLAKDNKVVIGGKLYADSIGDKDGPASSYYDMLKYNTDVIVEALTKEISENKQEIVEDESAGGWLWALMGLLFIGGFFLVVRKMNT